MVMIEEQTLLWWEILQLIQQVEDVVVLCLINLFIRHLGVPKAVILEDQVEVPLKETLKQAVVLEMQDLMIHLKEKVVDKIILHNLVEAVEVELHKEVHLAMLSVEQTVVKAETDLLIQLVDQM